MCVEVSVRAARSEAPWPLISDRFVVGVALAVILSSVRHISDKVFLEAAKVSVGAYLNLAETRGFSSGFLPVGKKNGF